MVNSVEEQLTPTSCAVGSLASAQQRDVLAAHDRSSKLRPITHNTWQRIRWLTRARAVCPASAERVRPAADVSGNWTNIAMGPWPAKQSSVASYRPATNPRTSQPHCRPVTSALAGTLARDCRFAHRPDLLRVDSTVRTRAPLQCLSTRCEAGRVNRRINRDHGESCGRESQGIHAWFP